MNLLPMHLSAALVLLAACGSSGGSATSDLPEGPAVSSSTAAAVDTPTESALPPIKETDEVAVADTLFGQLPVPRTGDDAVALIDVMPLSLESWQGEQHGDGQAVYQHPGGRLGIGAGELADIYARPVTAAEGVRLFRSDLDEGTAESCGSAPTRCVTGTMDGETVLAWSHDESEVLLVALWPTHDAGQQLLRAWLNAQVQ